MNPDFQDLNTDFQDLKKYLIDLDRRFAESILNGEINGLQPSERFDYYFSMSVLIDRQKFPSRELIMQVIDQINTEKNLYCFLSVSEPETGLNVKYEYSIKYN